MTEAGGIVDAIDEQMQRTMQKILILQQAYNFVLNANVEGKAADSGNLTESLDRLEQRLAPFGVNARTYFLSLLFLDLISELELYFASLIRLVILKHPKKAGSIQFKLTDIVEASSPEELVSRAADEFLYKLLYKKPNEYLSEMCSVLSVEQTLLAPFWETYIEAKARRDVGAHNDWKCNVTYLRKLSEVAMESDSSLGSSLVPSYAYFSGMTEAAIKIVEAIGFATREKHAG